MDSPTLDFVRYSGVSPNAAIIKVFAVGKGTNAYVSRNHYVGFGAKSIMDNRRGPGGDGRYRRNTDQKYYRTVKDKIVKVCI